MRKPSTCVAFLVVAALLAANASEAAPIGPRGVFSLTPPGAMVPPAILDDQRVAGVSIRSRWQDVEADRDRYDWSYLDEEIARAAAAGKRVFLRVVAGGFNTPDYVSAMAQTFSFTESLPYTRPRGIVTIPVFWDPALLARKQALIAAMGARFAGHPAVTMIGVSCANAVSDDWRVPHSPPDVENWRKVGYTSAKLITACKATIRAAMRAFPKQTIVMAINDNGPLDRDPNWVPRKVADWALATYPGRFYITKNSLSAVTPAPLAAAPDDDWRLLYERQPFVGAQMLWFVTEDAACRMNGLDTPCEAAATLRQAIVTGIEYGVQYVEIYQADILNPALSDVITDAALALQ